MNLVFFALLIQEYHALICPFGWHYFKDKCYFLSNHSMTFDNAEQECNTRFGGNLATLQSEAEDQFIHFLKTSRQQNRIANALFTNDGLFPADAVNICMFPEIRGNLCFQDKGNTAKISTETVILTGMASSSLCKQECIRARVDLRVECNSIIWIVSENECLLNIGNNTSDLVSSEEFQYFEDTCFDKPSENSLETPLAVPVSKVRNCFSKTRFTTLQGVIGKVYDRISMNDCLGECWNCKDCFEKDYCQTAIYYEEEATCVITNVTAKITKERIAKEEMSSLYEKRVKCLENNCEDLEVHLIFGIDPVVYNHTNTENILTEIFTEASRVTEYVRVTAVLLSSEPVHFFEDLQYENANDFKLRIQTLVVPEHTIDFEAGLIDFLNNVDEHWEITDDVDITWVLVLTDTSFESRLGLFLDLKVRFKDEFRRFPIFSIGIGTELDFEKLGIISSSPDNIIYLQDPISIGKALAPQICYQKPISRFAVKRKLKKSNVDQSLAWIGLHRTDFGNLEWIGKNTFQEYEINIAKHLTIEEEDGNCILRKGVTNWKFEQCKNKHNFICTLEPQDKLPSVMKKRINIRKLQH